ncbi:ATP-binding protein [Streptomyces sp. G-G2]|uniref:ATP-binding protein n=1 Tax=Streptomyces sp. G-G2 TaxID=3046201 RepID=UPI0024B8F67A|nr:ATP-binding protein [Streptomyces sp. G-G2]MDJ0379334.1 ATP-binding protein [Streptomyces sp. G-G2]
MEETDEGQPAGPRAGHRISVEGNAGAVIVGDHNMVVDAQHGSTVTVVMERERPRPVRRERVELLPRRVPEPVGRSSESAALADAVRAGGLVQLWGPPGVGKSTLLRHAARQLEPGPAGVVFLTAAYREVADLAQELFEACYEAPGYAPSRAELRRLMAGIPVTVYLDDADLTYGQLLDLADAAPDATFVFAASDRSLWNDGTALEIKGLDRAAGLELLARELRRPLREGELGGATDLWQAAAGLPLPLLRAAGLARLGPAGEARLPLPGEVASLLPELLEQLGTAELNVLHLMATLYGAVLDPVHIGALTDVPDAAGVCDRLAGLGLVVAVEHGYLFTTDVGPAVRQKCPSPFPAERLCEYFVQWAERADTTPAQVAGLGRALELAAELAERDGRPELAVRVARAASPALARSLRFGVWGRLLGRGWVSARATGDRQAEAYFTHEEAIRALLTGQRVLFVALAAEALMLWQALSNSHGAAAALQLHQFAAIPVAPTAPLLPSGATASAHVAAAHSGAAATPAQSVAAHMGNLAGNGGTAHAGTAGGAHLGTAGGAHAGTAHLGTTGGAHAGTAHVGTAHVGTAHAGTAHVGAAHAGTAHVGTAGTAHVGTAGTAHLGAAGGAHLGTAGTVGTMGTAGAGGAGAAAAAGGAAAAGTSMASLVATLIAVIVAIAVGGVALNQLQDDPPSATGLAGTWRDGEGTSIHFADAGTGSYSGRVSTQCGPIDVELTGSGDSYSGTQTAYGYLPDGSCDGQGVIGRLSMKITLSSDGSTATVVKGSTPGGPACAYSCETATLVRTS